MDKQNFVSHVYLSYRGYTTDFYVLGFVTSYKDICDNSFLRDFCKDVPDGTIISAQCSCFKIVCSNVFFSCSLKEVANSNFSFAKPHLSSEVD